MSVVILGLILLAGGAVLVAAVVTSNTGAVEVDLWGISMSNLSLGIVFVAGMITTVIAVAGLALVMAGLRRETRLRKERRVLRKENRRLSQQVGATTATTDGELDRSPGSWDAERPVTETAAERRTRVGTSIDEPAGVPATAEPYPSSGSTVTDETRRIT